MTIFLRSLQLNSVGLYQILKICTTPTIVLIEFFGYSKRAPLNRLAALAMICVGAAGRMARRNLRALFLSTPTLQSFHHLRITLLTSFSPPPPTAVTVTDVDVSPLGLMVGIVGVLVTSFYQVTTR